MVQIESIQGNALGVKVVDKLTDDDYKNVLIPGLEQILQNHDKVRVLVDATDFKGWSPSAAWDDAAFGMKHRNDFEKFAVVGGNAWLDWAPNWVRILSVVRLRLLVPANATRHGNGSRNRKQTLLLSI